MDVNLRTEASRPTGSLYQAKVADNSAAQAVSVTSADTTVSISDEAKKLLAAEDSGVATTLNTGLEPPPPPPPSPLNTGLEPPPPPPPSPLNTGLEPPPPPEDPEKEN